MHGVDLIGETIDGKYRIDRELGRGGMGTVYLATHLGTERPVAVKVIAPQFMQKVEFVERFRREARAAGRLRHPNVVNVTDFGFSSTKDGQVAYLVMEYLDGCTLGEVLDEEKNLPVSWTLDILEQVCSAVQEAHEQGIIHRDLKPDNIWLEPNQRGGYTVKVLDFGIAKLEDHHKADGVEIGARQFGSPTHSFGAHATIAADPGAGETMVLTEGTRIESNGVSEGQTAIYTPADVPSDDAAGTKILSNEINFDSPAVGRALTDHSLTGSETDSTLTRVGAVLGTPLYMSPEQCRGEVLDARSDIYSLGVIAYQMLSGRPPFDGDFERVMAAHKLQQPPPLEAKRMRRKMKAAIMSALAKNPEERPQSAEAFVSALRAREDGIFGLLRRALTIYSEHLPKFLGLTALLMLPAGLLTILAVAFQFAKVTESISEPTATILVVLSSLAVSGATFFFTYIIVAAITWMVVQKFAVPLRPVRVRPALREAAKKWRTLFGTGILTTVLTFCIGFLTCFIGFIFTSVMWSLVSPVLMLENKKGWAALKRSNELTKRSRMTAFGAVAMMFLIPFITAGAIGIVFGLAAKGIDKTATQITRVQDATGGESRQLDSSRPPAGEVTFSVGSNRVEVFDDNDSTRSGVKRAIIDSATQVIFWPLQIFFISFSSIIVSLLYIKTRLAGGETMSGLIERFEDDEKPRKRWQERVQQRLMQSGRSTGKPH
jgi:serine/threonine protein kinase